MDIRVRYKAPYWTNRLTQRNDLSVSFLDAKNVRLRELVRHFLIVAFSRSNLSSSNTATSLER